MAPGGLATPRVVWAEPECEEKPTGKNALHRAAAEIMKGGRGFVRAPSRSSSSRKRGNVGEGDSRSSSRFSIFMDGFNVGDGEQGRETPRRASADYSRDMDGELQSADGISRKSTSAMKDILSFRNPYKHHRRASSMMISSPIIDRSNENRSAIDSMRAECEDSSNCRAPPRKYTRIAPSGDAPVIPLLTFPSMINMPTLRQEEEDEVTAPAAEDEYLGEGYTLGQATTGRVMRANLVVWPARRR